MKKLVTHGNGFHADDVMAYAILKEALTKQGETWSLTRAYWGDPAANNADIVFDTGGVYDPASGRYDHHQTGRAGARENGILYASAGLIWKHFGHELCSNEAVWEAIDRGLISEIDAIDNGQNYIGELLFKDAGYTSFGMHLANFEADMFQKKTPEMLLAAFEAASEFARGVLVRMIQATEAQERAFQEATVVYNATEDKRILIFSKNYERPIWRRLSSYPEPIYLIYPNEFAGTWKAEAVIKNPMDLTSRKGYPESWRGLRDEEFSKVAEVPDGIFCHPGGFLMGTKSKESILELAKKSLSM